MYSRVQTKRSRWLGPILLALVLGATFVGGAISTLLSPAQVAKYLREKLAAGGGEAKVDFVASELLFFNGLFPRFGLKISGLEVRPKDSCSRGVAAKIDELWLPLSWRRLLFHKQAHILLARAQTLELRQLRPDCSSNRPVPSAPVAVASGEAPAAAASSAPALAPAQESDEMRRYVSERLPADRQKLATWIDGLNVAVLRWYPKEHLENTLEARELQLRWQDLERPIRLSVKLRPEGEWSLGPENPVELHLQGQLDHEVLKGQAQAEILEGRVELHFNWILTSQQLALRTKILTLPAVRAFAIARKLGWVTDNVQPKRTWLTCELFIQTELRQRESTSVELENCRLEGDAGRLALSKVKYRPYVSGSRVEPFTLNFEKLSLAQVLEAVGREGPSGVMSQFGEINGELEFISPEKIHFQGLIEKFELAFSNRSVRGKQQVESLRGAIHLESGRLSGLIDQVKMPQGVFDGLISFNVDPGFREGVFQVKVDKLAFQPSVQELMLMGAHEPLAIYGQGRFSGGEVVQWSGDFGTMAVKGEDWSAKELKLRTRFEAGVFKSQLKIRRLSLNTSHHFYTVLQPLFLDQQPKEDMEWALLVGDVEIQRSGGRWDRVQARSAVGDVVFASSGQWQSSGPWMGWIDVDFPQLKSLRWELGGSPVKPILQPSLKLLKELAARAPQKPLPDEWFKRSEDLIQWPKPGTVERNEAKSAPGN